MKAENVHLEFLVTNYDPTKATVNSLASISNKLKAKPRREK